jgi:hypothetical protein
MGGISPEQQQFDFLVGSKGARDEDRGFGTLIRADLR